MKKKIMALFLIVVLAFCLLAACAAESTADSSEGDAESSESSDSSDSSDIPQEAYDDVVSYLTDGAISVSDVVYTVDGADMSAGEFFYWLTYEAYIYSYTYYSSYYTYPDLTEELSDGTTMAEYIFEDAYYYSTMYAAIYAAAVSAGITLTDVYQESLDSYIPDASYDLGESAWETAVAAGTVSEDDYTDDEKEAWIEEQGSYEMNLYLMYYATDTDGLYDVYLRNYYYQQYEDVLYGEGGEYEPSDEDIADYAAEIEAYSCRYILFGDPDGDLSDDELEEYYAQALECYETLLALSGDELDSAIAEYAAENPDDNTTGEFGFDGDDTVTEGFLETLEGLETGELGMTAETDEGYYIIIRDEVTEDTELADSLTVFEHYVEEQFAVIVADIYENMEVVETGVMDGFDVNDFFDKLEELREIIPL